MWRWLMYVGGGSDVKVAGKVDLCAGRIGGEILKDVWGTDEWGLSAETRLRRPRGELLSSLLDSAVCHACVHNTVDIRFPEHI